MSSPNPSHQYPQYSQYPFAEQPQPPVYQQYPTTQQPDHGLPQSFSSEYNYSGQRASYIQPHYGTTSPSPFVAELPAALPQAPPTTTSAQQLNEDELLAHKLQNMEVEEARRRSNSNLSLRPSNYSLRDTPTLTPRASQNQLDTPGPRLPPRPHSESFSSMPFYGPDSFGPPPTSFETNDGRMLMAHPGLSENDNVPPPTPHAQSLPEVVVGPRPVSTAGFDYPLAVSISQPAPLPPPSQPHMSPTALATYLEVHREVPYPPQWRLPPVRETLYASSTRAPKSTDWLDTPLSRQWRTVRSSQNAVNPIEPSFSFTFKSSGGSLRDAKYSWTMAPGHWIYNLRIDNGTGIRKSELLTTPSNIDLITTYLPAANYDSLRFIGPDGRVYLWVAHAPLNSTNGARYDALRHALFMAPKGRDPLYGEIVADHAYWDGFIDYAEVHRVTCAGCGASPINGLRWKCKSCVDHDICEQCRLANKSVKSTCSFTLVNLPDEALYIRSPLVDPALIVATLQILKDWELHSLRMQKKRNPQGFKMSEDRAREGDLGRLTYWKSNDLPTAEKQEVKEVDPGKSAKVDKAKEKERAKGEKAKEKQKGKEKSKEKRKSKEITGPVGISELVRGSAHIGSAQIGGDVGDLLLRSESHRSGESTRS
ncbi:hypothetical protein N0V90_009237 [Kalmusia sp. IMI 367209]|nr:hypothetical protein N0V90_009237 [Kalmusia sp. IMI 367209]